MRLRSAGSREPVETPREPPLLLDIEGAYFLPEPLKGPFVHEEHLLSGNQQLVASDFQPGNVLVDAIPLGQSGNLYLLGFVPGIRNQSIRLAADAGLLVFLDLGEELGKFLDLVVSALVFLTHLVQIASLGPEVFDLLLK